MGEWTQAIAGLAQAIATMKDVGQEQIQQLMSQLPPQPKPEDFGWNPQQATQPTQANSILDQVIQASTTPEATGAQQ